MDEQEKQLRMISGEAGKDTAADLNRRAKTTPLIPLRSIWPDVLVDLESLLLKGGEFKLAASVDSLMVFDRCWCHAEYCAFVHTQPWKEVGWGPTHRTIVFWKHGTRTLGGKPKSLTREFLTILEIEDEQIVSIDIMDDHETRRRLIEALPDTGLDDELPESESGKGGLGPTGH